MDKKEFTETKTVISPDGKTVTTVTVSGNSEVSQGSSSVTTSVTNENSSRTTVIKSQ